VVEGKDEGSDTKDRSRNKRKRRLKYEEKAELTKIHNCNGMGGGLGEM